jgi:uncharacterized protein (TIGR00251 family)
MISCTERDNSITFSVRVQPRAGRNAIRGVHEGALKVALTAPPVDGRANEALRRFLAESLNVPASAVTILSGERSRTKRIEVRGATAANLRALAQSDSAGSRNRA